MLNFCDYSVSSYLKEENTDSKKHIILLFFPGNEEGK